MEIEFRRTGPTRYALEVRRDNFPDLLAATAPGFDPLAPHDLLHYLAESELDLRDGIFGQFALGGSSGFDLGQILGVQKRELSRVRRRAKRLNEKLQASRRREMEWSERATTLLLFEWLGRSTSAARRKRAESMTELVDRVRSKCSEVELNSLTPSVLDRVCDRLDALTVKWQQLSVGEGITVKWPFPEASKG